MIPHPTPQTVIVALLLALPAVGFAATPFPAVPASLALFTRAEEFHVKAAADTPDCAAAMAKAMEDATATAKNRGLPTIVAYLDDADPKTTITSLECKLTGKPDSPTGAVAEFRVLAVAEGVGSAFPQVTAARTTELALFANGLADGGWRRVSIIDEQGIPYLDLGEERDGGKLNTIQFDRNGRGVYAFQQSVEPWVRAWATLFASAPEIGGAIVSVKVKSENFVTKDEKLTEIFKFAVPVGAAGEFAAGTIAEQALLDRCIIFYGTTGRMTLDMNAGAR